MECLWFLMIFLYCLIFFGTILHHFAPFRTILHHVMVEKPTMAAPGSCGSSSASSRARCIASSSASPSSIASWTATTPHDTARHGVSHRVCFNGVLRCFNGVLWWFLMVYYDVWCMMIYDAQYAFRHPPLIYSLTIELHCVVVRQGVDLSWPFSMQAETCNEQLKAPNANSVETWC